MEFTSLFFSKKKRIVFKDIKRARKGGCSFLEEEKIFNTYTDYLVIKYVCVCENIVYVV